MLKKITIAAGLLLLLLVGAGVMSMGPRNVIGILTYGQQAREGSLQTGDPAPEVDLVSLDGETKRPLSDWTGERPLVLVFGSFT